MSLGLVSLEPKQVRHAAADDADGLAQAPAEAQILGRWQRLRHFAEIDEVRAHGTEPFQLLLDRLSFADGTAVVEILRKQDVLRHGDSVLQQSVHEDDVDTGKGLALPDGLLRDLADMGNAFQLELSGLDAPATSASVTTARTVSPAPTVSYTSSMRGAGLSFRRPCDHSSPAGSSEA